MYEDKRVVKKLAGNKKYENNSLKERGIIDYWPRNNTEIEKNIHLYIDCSKLLQNQTNLEAKMKNYYIKWKKVILTLIQEFPNNWKIIC